MSLREGERVRVLAEPPGPGDAEWAGQYGIFRGFSKPHGYAIVQIGQRSIMLHPESVVGTAADFPDERERLRQIRGALQRVQQGVEGFAAAIAACNGGEAQQSACEASDAAATLRSLLQPWARR